MPPQRSFPNPPPKTESAREAIRSFFCELCQKGYARQNDFAAHESSYDHQHKQRLKDLKALNRNMDATIKSGRKNEDKGADIIKITPIALKSVGAAGGGGGGGFKKGGFKSAFGTIQKEEEGAGEVKGMGKDGSGAGVEKKRVEEVEVEELESESEDEGYERYDPRKPTDCFTDCRGRG